MTKESYQPNICFSSQNVQDYFCEVSLPDTEILDNIISLSITSPDDVEVNFYAAEQ